MEEDVMQLNTTFAKSIVGNLIEKAIKKRYAISRLSLHRVDVNHTAGNNVTLHIDMSLSMSEAEVINIIHNTLKGRQP